MMRQIPYSFQYRFFRPDRNKLWIRDAC
jgi:hypothetical protein